MTAFHRLVFTCGCVDFPPSLNPVCIGDNDPLISVIAGFDGSAFE
jgi:hypothetical protein